VVQHDPDPPCVKYHAECLIFLFIERFYIGTVCNVKEFTGESWIRLGIKIVLLRRSNTAGTFTVRVSTVYQSFIIAFFKFQFQNMHEEN
jgi:hypothetical protein